MAKKLPIFLDQNGKAVSAYNASEKLQLFLPFEGNTFYLTVNENLLNNEETKKFINKMGIEKPHFKDEIINVIIPKYEQKDIQIDPISDFKKFFGYYKECSRNQVNEFIKTIKDIDFIISFTNNKNEKNSVQNLERYKASCLYFPSDFLLKYFETKPQTLFINIGLYKKNVDKSDEKLLNEFFEKLGVSKTVRFFKYELPLYVATSQYKISIPHYTRYIHLYENQPDGFTELFESIKSNPKKSVILWNYLLKICKKNQLQSIELGACDYFYRTDRYEFYQSTVGTRLKTEKWILNSKNELVSPKQVFLNELKEHYEVGRPGFPILLKFLNIKEKIINENFTQEQQEDLDLVKELKEKGLLDEVKSLLNRKNIQNMKTRSIKFENDELGDDDDLDDSELFSKGFNLIQKVGNKVAKRILSNPSFSKSRKQQDDEIDEDDFINPNKTLNNRFHIASEFMKNEKEIEKMAQLEQLRLTVDKSEIYSFLWFKTLLLMESVENNYDSNSNKSISIVFSKIELEEGTTRTLALMHPSRYIPLYLEELSNIPLSLHFDDGSNKSLLIEVINVQSYSIRAKFKSPSELEGIDLNSVKEAEISATNPVFLSEELRKSFLQLNFDDGFNLFQNLTEKIEFIFGPPGTGKTTYLAQKVLIPLIQQPEEKNVKILVLTPTNKAADVVVNRIIECMSDDNSFKKWLVRFGTESDESLEFKSVYREKTFDIQKLDKTVTVTTVARFTYDFFNPEGQSKVYLKELNWDYVVLDEASMIPLVSIIYALYKCKPIKFIIAGDPFQIQPIATADPLKNENIYSMVELDSFTDPKTNPHPYHVELLTTQYRSVPSVGNIYSKLTYGGILRHYRSEDSKKRLNLDEFIKLSSLNIIKFPVSKYESIYKPRKLQNKSSYHVYSSLLVFESVKYLSQKLALPINQSQNFSIGVIAAYRAQTDLIDKLVSSFVLPKNVKVQIGTIHGFQGDECDIILAVFNPPPKITASPEMFLNNQNIINVSISRTRDYLLVFMPDDRTENVGMLEMVKKVESLCKGEEFNEYSSGELEMVIFGDEKYLEKNSFATSHQLVNVYHKPEKKYEIRCDETAADIFVNNS